MRCMVLIDLSAGLSRVMIANVRPIHPVDSGEMIYRFATSTRLSLRKNAYGSSLADSGHRISANFNVANDCTRPTEVAGRQLPDHRNLRSEASIISEHHL